MIDYDTPIPSPEIHDRNGFCDLCNKRALLKHVVEIGTERGGFASQFLKRWGGHQMICVDPWETGLAGYDELTWDRSPDYDMAVAALAPFTPRVRIFRGTTDQFIDSGMIEWPLDFVYVDGNHSYGATKNDINKLWPRVAGWGMLAGHDYCDALPGVPRAVKEFARRVKRQIYLTSEPGHPSWYVYKDPRPPFCYSRQWILNEYAQRHPGHSNPAGKP